MGNDVIRMLRYNTGTDKKAFVNFKNDFDAVIFNATIVAYSGSAIADLVSVHKNKYIIDPQTHILQHDVSAIMSKSRSNGEISIKKSVKKYLECLPDSILNIIERGRNLTISEIGEVADKLTEDVYNFEVSYVNSFIKNKEYDKYLKYANIGPEPKVIIAPYFMLKKGMSSSECEEIISINQKCINKFISIQNSSDTDYPVAAQLVMDRELLKDGDIIKEIRYKYADLENEYIFIWVSDFSSWECDLEEKKGFNDLVYGLNSIGKKPVMAYGGYDSIFLCNSELSARLYGVAQSVGYGETRSITPVGGGLPINKYYFGPLHLRMRFDEALSILINSGYFDDSKNDAEHAKDYYRYICNCQQCQQLIQNDINNFSIYNESNPYTVHAKYGDIKRNRPTSDAMLVAAFHFLHRKKIEWDEIEKKSLSELKEELIDAYNMYGTEKQIKNIKEWCDIFAK